MVRRILATLVVAACSINAQAANVPPTVALSSPAANAVFVTPTSVTLSATAADRDGTIAGVSFYRGTTLIGSKSAAPFTYVWASVPAGSYSITARATDNSRAVTTSAARLITVKTNTLPSVSIATPTASASFAAPGTIALTANASDTDGTVAKVVFYSGTTQIGSATAPPYAATWANAAIGSYSLTAKATDDKGGVKTSVAVNIVVKANAAPSVSLTAPLNGAKYYTPATISLSANAADSDGTVSNVSFYSGTTLIGSATSAPYVVSWPNVSAGSYSISAKATDDKGAVTSSPAAAITVAAAPAPTVSVTGPANNARYRSPASFTLTANAAVSGDTISKVEYISGANVVGTATAAPYAVSLTNIGVGTYTVSARATGTLGGTATSAPIILVVNANSAPTVTLDASPANTTAPGAITLNAAASDSDGTVLKVEFLNGASVLATLTQAPYTYVWNGVAADSYQLSARATDNDGGVTTSAPQTVTVAAPAAVPQAFFIYTDQINTAREITNAAGVKVWEADTDPFGANLPNENPAGQGLFAYNPRFPGQYFDRETGLHYNYYRDYDPQTGRYIQSDPIGLEGGINTYGYVDANPLLLVDPLGLAPGDRYKSPDAAGVQAIRDINPRSIREDYEYGGRVYRRSDGSYSYTAPAKGERRRVPLDVLPVCPPGTTNSGTYHTHANAPSTTHRPEIFSGNDQTMSDNEGVPSYLGTPSGQIMKYTPVPGVPYGGTAKRLGQGAK